MKITIAASAFLLAGSTLLAVAAPLAPSAIQGHVPGVGAQQEALFTEVRHRPGHWNRGRHLGWYKKNRGRHLGWRKHKWR